MISTVLETVFIFMCWFTMHNKILIMDSFSKSFQATLLARMVSHEHVKPECS